MFQKAKIPCGLLASRGRKLETEAAEAELSATRDGYQRW